MPDLATIIRDYYESCAEPVTAAEAMARAERTDLQQHWTIHPHRAIAFASAALVFALAVGLAALLLPGESNLVDQPITPTSQITAPTTQPTVAPTTATPPTTATIPPVAEGPMTWSRMPFEGQVYAVVASDSGLIAAGSSNFTTSMWRSSDGKTWTQIALDRDVFGGYRISDLVANDGGYTAIGSDGKTAVVTWTSPDGLEWIRTPVEGFEPEEIGRLVINALTDGPSGLVAVGWTHPANLSYMLEDHVVIHSADGTAWQRADTADLPLGGMKDVTAGGPGYVAVGVDWSDRSNSRPGVWTSADGVNWTLIDGAGIEGGPGHDAGMERLGVADDGRLYAFGSIGPVWVSEDVSTWSRIGEYQGEPEDGFWELWSGAAYAGVVSGDRVVLVGSLEIDGSPGDDRAAAWASGDGGRTWERMSRPPDVFGGDHGESEIDRLVEVDGTYVAFGEWNGERSVWIGAWNEEE